MDVHQMFLQLIRLGEVLGAAAAAIFCAHTQIVQGGMGFQVLLAGERGPTLHAFVMLAG